MEGRGGGEGGGEGGSLREKQKHISKSVLRNRSGLSHCVLYTYSLYYPCEKIQISKQCLE